MNFKPKNRHLLLEQIKTSSEETSTVLVPEEYKVRTNPYAVYRVLAVADDCAKFADGDINKTMVVNDSMVEIIDVGHGQFTIVLENHVIGTLTE